MIMSPNKALLGTLHKVSGPQNADVGDKNMKTIIALGILLATAFISLGDFAPPESSGLIVTGAWQFVHADGSITNGTWTHENMDDVHLMTHDPTEYAKHTGKTGLLVMWWDIERSRRCTIAEYRKGKENGYWVHWYPSGELQSCGILKNNRLFADLCGRGSGPGTGFVQWQRGRTRFAPVRETVT